MKLGTLISFAILALGCANYEGRLSALCCSSAPNIKPRVGEPEFSDEVFLVPQYSGATKIPNRSKEVNDKYIHSYDRMFYSIDSVDRVGDYYQNEFKKVGKLIDTSRDNKPGQQRRTLIVRISPGYEIQVSIRPAKDKNGSEIAMQSLMANY